MKIEIYRKRNLPHGFCIDDEPERIVDGIAWIEICQPDYIHANINGEELTIKTDYRNYQYIFR